MKGTNPETQGHRWAKRVKKRLKKEQREDGQWEALEREKARKAEEAAAAATEEASASESASGLDDLDGATDLRDEEGLDPAELAAVRAVKAAAAAAAERLARLEKDADATREGDEKRERTSDAKPAAGESVRRAPVSSNPFAALGRSRRPRHEATSGGGAAFRGPDGARTGRAGAGGGSLAKRFDRDRAGESATDARRRLAAEGAAAARDRKRALGVSGVPGSSAKRLKKLLKKQRERRVWATNGRSADPSASRHVGSPRSAGRRRLGRRGDVAGPL